MSTVYEFEKLLSFLPVSVTSILSSYFKEKLHVPIYISTKVSYIFFNPWIENCVVYCKTNGKQRDFHFETVEIPFATEKRFVSTIVLHSLQSC